MSESVNGFIHTATATNGWDRMIADARKRINRLEIAIRTFTQRKANGDRCPIVGCEDPMPQLEGHVEVRQHSV
jgi:hypothetical protein